MEVMWYEQIKSSNPVHQSSPEIQSSNPVHNTVQWLDMTNYYMAYEELEDNATMQQTFSYLVQQSQAGEGYLCEIPFLQGSPVDS